MRWLQLVLVTAWWGAATARLRRDAGNNNGKAEHRMSSSVELGAGFFKMIPDHESECANLLHTKDRVEESGEPFRNFFFMHIPKTAGTSFGGQCGLVAVVLLACYELLLIFVYC